MKVHVLTDDEKGSFIIETYALGLGYRCSVSNQIAEFQAKSRNDNRYYLIIDYPLSSGDSRQLLLDLLDSGNPPGGLLVMSGLPGFEDFLDRVSEKYADADIPFLFMEKPFDRVELGELLFRLGRGLEGRIFGCLRLPKYGFVHVDKFGSILRAARENLGLELRQVAAGAGKKGMQLSEGRLQEIEADDTGKDISGDEWIFLTHLLYERADSPSTGFEPWIHLRRVRHALEEKNYTFPMNFALHRKLVELAKREKIESKYFSTLQTGKRLGV